MAECTLCAMSFRRCALLLLSLTLLAATGCEKPTHDNLDKWMRTKQGPEKLAKAFASSSIDADLSAHAAVNMIKKGLDSEVRTAFETMNAERRQAVIDQMVERLWTVARVEGELTVPSAEQVSAKDALFDVRKFASDGARAKIDEDLTDWYTSGNYKGRSEMGHDVGPAVMRTLGPAAAPRLIQVANAIVARSPSTTAQGSKYARFDDELMLGLAATGSPDAVKYLLDMAHMELHDATQLGRAMSALHKAYAKPDGLFEVADKQALVANVGSVVAIAKSDQVSASVANTAVDLIAIIGMPACLEPLVGMVAEPHSDPSFRYVGANSAIKCGGSKAITPVLDALPDASPYDHADLGGAVWGEIARLAPPDQAKVALRDILKAKGKSKIARWVAIEALAKMKSTEDAALIKSLAGDRAILDGYWGAQDGVSAKERKKTPTLGQRATELAATLGAP